MRDGAEAPFRIDFPDETGGARTGIENKRLRFRASAEVGLRFRLRLRLRRYLLIRRRSSLCRCGFEDFIVRNCAFFGPGLFGRGADDRPLS
ncbi:hypothetical protein D3C80_1879410 [compost metagenome]